VIIALALLGVGKQLVVEPDPAFIKVGEHVIWELIVSRAIGVDSVEWTIYFSSENPFRPTIGASWTQVTKAAGSGENKEVLEVGPVLQPGDYKYGVRTKNLVNGQKLSDDDPRLLVRL
jgi:hypothetical protein